MEAVGENRKQIIQMLERLNSVNIGATENNVSDLCRSQVDQTCADLKQEFSALLNSLREIGLINADDNSVQWKYVLLNFYLLRQLQTCLTDNDIFSVQESGKLKTAFRNMCYLGIFCNLQPNLPLYKKIDDDDLVTLERPELIRYHRLTSTLNGLICFIKCLQFRSLIIPDILKAILAGLYQVVYCPLKKPSDALDTSKFAMSKDLYDSLLKDRDIFKQHFEYFRTSIYRPIYVRETMLLVNDKTPMWFKIAVSSNLTSILRSKNGVQSIAAAMLDGATNDDTKTWNALGIMAKLVLSCKSSPDFRENVCQQVIELLQPQDAGGGSLLFERIFIVCTKRLYTTDKPLCEQTFVKHVVNVLLAFGRKATFADGENITEIVSQCVRICYACFIEHNIDSPVLPIKLLNPTIVVLFRIYLVTLHSSLRSINNESRELILRYLEQCDQSTIFLVFDTCLFGMLQENFADTKELKLVVQDNSIAVRYTEYNEAYSIDDCGDTLTKLVKNNPRLMSIVFSYLLNCLIYHDRYFKDDGSKDLLLCETNEFLTESVKRKLVVFQLLSNLAENKVVQKHISDQPTEIIEYIRVILSKTVDTKMHKTSAFESSGFQTIFTLMMVLQVLASSCSQENLKYFEMLVDPLRTIQSDSSSEELKNLVTQILDCLTGMKAPGRKHLDKEVTELDKAIEDICDPLVPVRGHGLMTLAKLVEKKDKHAMERKQYILNIFQQNLKNDDSYIYLSAINGLAALCDVFPDVVLDALTEEYSDFSKHNNEDGNELRMKLGEVLVRITRMLGEMAPKYKSLLLNTFLVGTKDDDHLIRASSLSNLGEVCGVLGYKLGTVVTEILVCVDAIIETDKAVEARRAAVTVIRQLFTGLEKETLAFLKDDILPIYRKLKYIYNNDADDVMRLQAQLALEELNENMKSFVFPRLPLNDEKKILLLK